MPIVLRYCDLKVSGCKVSLSQGHYRWQHSQVLKGKQQQENSEGSEGGELGFVQWKWNVGDLLQELWSHSLGTWSAGKEFKEDIEENVR